MEGYTHGNIHKTQKKFYFRDTDRGVYCFSCIMIRVILLSCKTYKKEQLTSNNASCGI